MSKQGSVRDGDIELMRQCIEDVIRISTTSKTPAGKQIGKYDLSGSAIATLAAELFRWRRMFLIVSVPVAITEEQMALLQDVFEDMNVQSVIVPENIKTRSVTPEQVVFVNPLSSTGEDELKLMAEALAPYLRCGGMGLSTVKED